VELDEVVFFMRKGHLLPLAKGGKKIQSVADVDFADLRLLAYAPDGASYEYYTDDGETKDYDKPERVMTDDYPSTLTVARSLFAFPSASSVICTKCSGLS